MSFDQGNRATAASWVVISVRVVVAWFFMCQDKVIPNGIEIVVDNVLAGADAAHANDRNLDGL